MIGNWTWVGSTLLENLICDWNLLLFTSVENEFFIFTLSFIVVAISSASFTLDSIFMRNLFIKAAAILISFKRCGTSLVDHILPKIFHIDLIWPLRTSTTKRKAVNKRDLFAPFVVNCSVFSVALSLHFWTSAGIFTSYPSLIRSFVQSRKPRSKINTSFFRSFLLIDSIVFSEYFFHYLRVICSCVKKAKNLNKCAISRYQNHWFNKIPFLLIIVSYALQIKIARIVKINVRGIRNNHYFIYTIQLSSHLRRVLDQQITGKTIEAKMNRNEVS